MDKRSTNHQLARIAQMHADNQLPFEATQEFIRAHSKKKLPKAKQGPADPKLAYWEEKFPGKGETLMSVLRPFYDWKPEVKPALPNLEERAREAIFWRKIERVKAVDGQELNSIRLHVSGSGLGIPEMVIPRHATGAHPLSSELRGLLWQSLQESFWGSIHRSDAIWESSFACCERILDGRLEEAFKFKYFHELWFAGNLLQCCVNGCLYVQVASERIPCL